RRRHTRCLSDWSSDVCSSDLNLYERVEIHHSCPERSPRQWGRDPKLHERFEIHRFWRSAFLHYSTGTGSHMERNAVLQTLRIARSEERRVGKECRCRE